MTKTILLAATLFQLTRPAAATEVLGLPLPNFQPYQYIGKTGQPTTALASVLMLLRKRGGQHVPTCTGTLIAPDKVLTAAHCFCGDGSNKEITAARCKPDVRNWQAASQHAGRVGVRDIMVHPGYTWRSSEDGGVHIDSDLAVITLSGPVRGLNPASLAASAPKPGDSMRMAGFGFTGGGPLGSPVVSPGLLVEVNALVAACPDNVSGAGLLCRRDSGSQVSRTCSGDSGGPGLDSAARVVSVASAISDPCPKPSVAIDMDVTAPFAQKFLRGHQAAASSPMARVIAVPQGALSRLDSDNTAKFVLNDLLPGYPETLVVANTPSRASKGGNEAPQTLTIAVDGAACDPLPSVPLLANVAECRFDSPESRQLNITVTGSRPKEFIQVVVTMRVDRLM